MNMDFKNFFLILLKYESINLSYKKDIDNF